MASSSVKLRPRARLLKLIGEDLISDEAVAVVELVKNSYDADATHVSISFASDQSERPAWIEIKDNGHGMDLTTVLTTWFEPGTAVKDQSRRSPKGRSYQGAKGIGRFAAARLAETMLLESKSKGKDSVSVLFNWVDFEKFDYLDQIEVVYDTGTVRNLPVGTRITLSGLRRDWAIDDYNELHARLSRLISPFDDVRDFTIELDVPFNPELSGLVTAPELLLKPHYELTGEVSKKGRFKGTVRVGDQREDIEVELGRGAPPCGSFRVEIRAWDRDRKGLAPIAASTGYSVKQVRDTLDIYSGVSIYRDGFRVHPYGQRGNDWLRLDLRSRLNPRKNLANNQVVAAIRITRDDNPELRDRSTREGLVLNAEYEALRSWFIHVLSTLEETRYKERRDEKETDSVDVDPLFEAFDLKSVVAHAKAELGSEHPVTKMVISTQSQVQDAVQRVQEVFSRFLLSAGLGHMVDVVIHEIGSPLGKINRQLVALENALKRMLSEDDFMHIALKLQSIRSWLEQIHNLRERLEPQAPAKRGRATSFDVLEEVKDNLDLYEALLHRQQVDVAIETSEDSIRVKMSRAALGQILANLVDNSLYWIIRKHGSGKGGILRIVVERKEGGFSIRVNDDGPGVPDSDRAIIFEPYFTRKPSGMGLGLYIARLLIEPYGRLTYNDSCELPGACFEAKFEKGVGL